MDFDWKHLLRTETSQVCLWKTLYYNNEDTVKVKGFQSLSDKEIYFILQSNSIKYKKRWQTFEIHFIFIKFELPLRAPYSQSWNLR